MKISFDTWLAATAVVIALFAYLRPRKAKEVCPKCKSANYKQEEIRKDRLEGIDRAVGFYLCKDCYFRNERVL